jgi:tRNA-2-methylthio-N6-dimethylallyladenosine synthase
LAGRKMEDDVPGRNQSQTFARIVDLQQKTCLATKEEFIGKTVEVLIEKLSKKRRVF